MARYFTKRRASDDEDYWPDAAPLITNLTACDHEAVDTGLLDADGNTILRAPNPMGFIWND